MGPTFSLQEFNYFLVLQFDDLEEFSERAAIDLENLTAKTVKDSLEEVNEDEFVVLASYQYQEPFDYSTVQRSRTLAGRSRRLQIGRSVGMLLLVDVRSGETYGQEKIEDDIRIAFDQPDERTDFFNTLQNSNPEEFRRINSMQIIINDEIVVLKRAGRSSWIYIGSGIGGATLVISLFLFFSYRRRRNNSNPYIAEFENMPPVIDERVSAVIEVEAEGDHQEISTLGDPVYGGPTEAIFPGALTFGRADEPSQESNELSVGYDYKMAYGGAGDMPSVSSAGGTKSAAGPRALADDLTTDESRIRTGSEGSRITDSGEQVSFEDDSSFEQMYGSEERIEVLAPSGKLGVVIDTPLNGAPMVHAIKESSVLADKIRIGDKLIAVDGEDTTDMSAIKVSKLISSKASNPKRHMIFMRSISQT